MTTYRETFRVLLTAALLVLGSDGHWGGSEAQARPDEAKQGQKAKGAPQKSAKTPGNQGKADKGNAAAQSGNGGDGVQHGSPALAKAKWTRDWRAEDFLRAGFSVAALHELLGGNTTVLHVGAKPLPPGIAKNLARGKPLPPGIAKRYADPQVLPHLPRVEGHEWHQIGRDLVLVALGTYLVVEILESVFD